MDIEVNSTFGSINIFLATINHSDTIEVKRKLQNGTNNFRIIQEPKSLFLSEVREIIELPKKASSIASNWLNKFLFTSMDKTIAKHEQIYQKKPQTINGIMLIISAEFSNSCEKTLRCVVEIDKQTFDQASHLGIGLERDSQGQKFLQILALGHPSKILLDKKFYESDV